jgi:hypothetical protein
VEGIGLSVYSWSHGENKTTGNKKCKWHKFGKAKEENGH